MRHLVFESYGSPSVLTVTESQPPVAGPRQVVLRVTHAGVNFAEVMFRRGQIPVDLPHTPGLEAVGVVDQVGTEVDGISVGDRVAALTLAGGGQSEYAVAEAAFVVPLTQDLANLDDAHAAAALCNGTTAVGALELAGRPQPGERVLVTAAAGGVGSWLIDLLVGRSCTVIAATSNPEKVSLPTRKNVTEILTYAEIAGAPAFDVVFDSVGGSARATLREKITVLGRHVIMGDAAQEDTSINCDSLWFGGSALVGYNLGALAYHRPELLRQHMRAALSHALTRLERGSAGGITAHRIVAADQLPQVHTQLEDRTSHGKFVLRW